MKIKQKRDTGGIVFDEVINLTDGNMKFLESKYIHKPVDVKVSDASNHKC
jgi:hypothetical protein